MDANILIARIIEFLKIPNLVFLYNVDNWGNTKNFQAIVDNTDIHAHIFRVTPLILNTQSKTYQTFVTSYQEKFHRDPNGALSYMTYRCVMSVVDALQKFPAPSQNAKISVLTSYLVALKKDKNWYRITTYIIYKHMHEHDIKLGIITTHEHT